MRVSLRNSVRSDLFRLVISSVSALALMSAGLAFLFLRSLGQSMDSERRDYAAQAIPVIRAALETPLTALKASTLPPFITQLKEDAPLVRIRLGSLLQAFPFFLHFLVVDQGGKVVMSVPEQVFLSEVNLSQNPWFQSARTQKKIQYSKVGQNYLTGQAEFTLSYPLGEDLIIFAALDVHTLLGDQDYWRQGDRNKELLIVEDTGTYIYHPDQNKVRQQQVDAAFLREKLRSESGNFEYSQQIMGRSWGIVAMALPEYRWYVLARQDQEGYWSTFLFTAVALLTGLGVLLILELRFALGISRKIWTGIDSIAGFASDVGKGIPSPAAEVAYYSEYQDLMTHLTLMADRIQEREGFLRSLVENIPFSFWSLDKDGQVLWTNDQAARTGNLKQGTHLRDSSLAGEEIAFFLESLGNSYRGHQSQQEVRRPGPEEIYLILHAAPIFQAGRLRGQLCFEQDVSPIRKAEQTIRRQVAELEQFTYAASHDLKSPLITIQGFLGGMKGDLLSGRMERALSDLERVIKAVDRMGSLVTDLLELSRVGRIPGTLTPCAMGDLFGEAVEMLEGIFSGLDHRILRETDFPTLPGDKSRLREVWQNLLENAVKYRLPDRTLELRCGCRATDGQWEFYLSDNGRGIEAAYQEKVFGLFEQLDKNSGGTGIGLALVRRIIEHNGGRIWIESPGINMGTTVYFTLPKPQEEL